MKLRNDLRPFVFWPFIFRPFVFQRFVLSTFCLWDHLSLNRSNLNWKCYIFCWNGTLNSCTLVQKCKNIYRMFGNNAMLNNYWISTKQLFANKFHMVVITICILQKVLIGFAQETHPRLQLNDCDLLQSKLETCKHNLPIMDDRCTNTSAHHLPLILLLMMIEYNRIREWLAATIEIEETCE